MKGFLDKIFEINFIKNCSKNKIFLLVRGFKRKLKFIKANIIVI